MKKQLKNIVCSIALLSLSSNIQSAGESNSSKIIESIKFCTLVGSTTAIGFFCADKSSRANNLPPLHRGALIVGVLNGTLAGCIPFMKHPSGLGQPCMDSAWQVGLLGLSGLGIGVFYHTSMLGARLEKERAVAAHRRRAQLRHRRQAMRGRQAGDEEQAERRRAAEAEPRQELNRLNEKDKQLSFFKPAG